MSESDGSRRAWGRSSHTAGSGTWNVVDSSSSSSSSSSHSSRSSRSSSHFTIVQQQERVVYSMRVASVSCWPLLAKTLLAAPAGILDVMSTYSVRERTHHHELALLVVDRPALVAIKPVEQPRHVIAFPRG